MRTFMKNYYSLFIILVLVFASVLALAADNVAPEASLYLTHNKIFRSRLAAGVNYNTNDAKVTSGTFEYDLDVGLMPFFRRYVFKDPNVEKAQRLTAQVGYADLGNENRGILEVTGRLPVGGTWLVSDRNKGDFRWIDGEYSARYRNRLRLEHSVAFAHVKCTPYANGEVYYDFKANEWNRTDLTLGGEFPLPYKTVFEVYVTHAMNRAGPKSTSVGIVFQKHMVASLREGT
jgi:hypothetical protein